MISPRIWHKAARPLAEHAVAVLQRRLRPPGVARAARWMVRQANPPLQIVRDDTIDALAISDDVGRALLLGKSRGGVTAADILEAVDRPELVGPAAVALSNTHGAPGELSRSLFETIVLGQMGPSERTQAALIAVRRHPELLSSEHAQAISKRLLTLAGQPVDPYNPHPVRTSAAAAAATLVAARDELDSTVMGSLGQPGLRFVAAAAVQGRRDRPEELLAGILDAIAPSADGAMRFARSCDRNYSVLDSVVHPAGLARLRGRCRDGIRRVTDRMRWLLPAIGLVAFSAASASMGASVDAAVIDLPAALRMSGGAGLGSFALLVAVHLFSAEIAANRLPGPIARATSVPLPLVGCYLLAGCALVLGQVSSRAIDPATVSAVTYGLLAGFAVAFSIALLQLLARTDSTAAAAAFVRRRRARVRAGGRALGELHRHAIAARKLVATMPWLKATLSAPMAERRARIDAPHDGYLMISKRRLSGLATDDWWNRSAGRLWLSAPVGTRVDRGQEIAALASGDTREIRTSRQRQIRRVMSVRPQDGAEEAAESVAVLIDLMARLGASGNEAGGFRVADETVRLLEAHLDGVRAGRGRHQLGEDHGNAIPALRTAAYAVAEAMTLSQHPFAREVLQRFTQRLLPHVGEEDGFCQVLLGELDKVATAQPSTANLLLWDLGTRVVETMSPLLAFSWQSALAHLAADAEQHHGVIQIGGRVVSFASYVDGATAHRLYRTLFEKADMTVSEDFLVLLRIGASALRAGSLSLATRVALDCRPIPLDPWVMWAATSDAIAIEETRNELYGLTLGPDVQLVLQRFIAFAVKVSKMIPAPSAAGPTVANHP